jgi:hypothetical protein
MDCLGGVGVAAKKIFLAAGKAFGAAGKAFAAAGKAFAAANPNRFGTGKAGGQTVRKGRKTASTWAGTGLGGGFRVPVIMEKSVLSGKNISFINFKE